MRSLRVLPITVRKYDGCFRFSTSVEVIHQDCDLVIGLGKPGRVLERDGQSRILTDWSLEYLPLSRPYNIVSFYDTDGRLKFHFCNVLMDACLTQSGLSYIDLDLDVRVARDGSWYVEDEADFERNVVGMGYTDEVRWTARRGLEQIVGIVESRRLWLACGTLSESLRYVSDSYEAEHL